MTLIIAKKYIKNTASPIVVVTAPLHSNGIYPIIVCVFVAAGMCLPRRSLAMGLHVTIFINHPIINDTVSMLTSCWI
jgi:hypothetical protein